MSSRSIPDRTDLLTVEQVAAYLQLNKLTVYRYIREGRIPAARLGKVYRVRKSDVDAFLESRKFHPGRATAPAARSNRRRSRGSTRRVARVAPSEETVVRPPRRDVPAEHPEVSINPMDWVIRGLH